MSRDEPYNAGDSADLKQAAKEARRDAREDEDIYRQIMSTGQGRAWMHRRLGNCCVFQPTFTGEALQSAYLEGQRNIGLMMLNEITRLSPDLFILMLREANDRIIASDVERNRARTDDTNNANPNDAQRFVDYNEPAGPSNGSGKVN